MSASLSELQKIPTSFASCSLHPSPSKPLPSILSAIASASFTGIELSFPNLLSHASSLTGKDVSPSDFETLCGAAADVKKRCHDLNLEIMLLQPFANFEGWPRGSKEREEAFTRAKGWIRIMLACGCKTLQVGSTDTPQEKISTDRKDVVQDLRELADLLAPHGFRMAYENWCWSTHAPGWREVWDIVNEVDRDNVGLCLDTFQSAGGEWGDPTTESGLVELEGHEDKASVVERWEKSLEDLAATVPKEKIYLLQISDAYRMKKPLEDKEVDGLRPRGRWSHDYRPLVGEGRGYLPCADFARAVSKSGFRGWWSYEVFDWPDWETKTYNEDRDLEEYAHRARKGHENFLKEVAEK